MDDDEAFERSMEWLGVEPVGRQAPEPARGRDVRREAEDRRLFEQAMADLNADDQGGCGAGAAPRSPPPKPRRLKTRSKHLRVEEQLDLHGLRGDEAVRRLGHFVAQAAAARVRTVLVITGKGHRAPGGRGVLRQRVEQWIRGRGGRRVRAWSEAPARRGGRGAFVLFLRTSPE